MSHDGVPFAEFYARYHRRVHGFAITAYGRNDADDLAQDAMLRAYRSYDRLDPGRDPWPWLVAILRNVARDRYARPAAVPLAEVPAVTADATGHVEERAVVRAALGRLSRSDRDVLLLREWHELTFGELAGLLGRSPNTVRQQVFRARRRLAEAYTALGGRALAVAGWLRRPQGAGQLAAVVLGGALAVPAPGPPPPVAPPPATAGPAAHGETPSGPAGAVTAPGRPLLRPGTAPPGAPRVLPRRVERARAAVSPADTRPSGEPYRGSRTATGKAGHERDTAPSGGPGVVCALTAVCPRR